MSTLNNQIAQAIGNVTLTLTAVAGVTNVDISYWVLWYWFKGIHTYMGDPNIQRRKVS